MQTNQKKSLIDILFQHTQVQGDRRAFAFLADGESITESLTFAEVGQHVALWGSELQRVIQPQAHVVIAYPPGLEYIIALLSCFYAGTVAVPLYPPKKHRADPRYKAILADADIKLVLAPAQLTERIRTNLPTSIPIVATPRSSPTNAVERQPTPLNLSGTAVLQYTSGSTGTPKGIRITHSNLLHNLAYSQALTQATPADILVSWLPFYHDMGLIAGLFLPLMVGFPAYLMPPTAFLQRPGRWLEALTRFKATISGGPNFAYELCTRRITPAERQGLDLSAWKTAANGAEPIRTATMQQFADRFAPYGFRLTSFVTTYGLAEATLAVAHGTHENKLQWPEECQLLIVNPNNLSPCTSGEEGEIWVQSASVGQGYWRNPAATADTFQAYTVEGRGPFLRTGDLGQLVDGQLMVTGRLKDLIIIRGQNYYPQDIEHAAASAHPALEPAKSAAFTIDHHGEQQLVVVQEVRLHYHRWLRTTLIEAIRQAVIDNCGVYVHDVVLIKPATLPITTNGKVQRFAVRQAYQDDTLHRVEQWQSKPFYQTPASTHEPIAVISMSCRFPGANNAAEFWQLLCDGVDAITEVPADRWDVDQFYDPNPLTPGKMNTRWGGFLMDIDRFDPHFFGISPREATRMDPQQRLMLEVCYEALENAGQTHPGISGSPTGVFVGVSTGDYGGLQIDPKHSDLYMGTGSAATIVPNRVSHLLNLRGPSLAVDTACSSALVAVHLACQSIWQGESTMALAGGVNVILMPSITVNFTKAGMMSPTGRCRAFSDQADGYVRGEGAGVVLLKPLSQAMADGDPIDALILGTATNQDGRSQGLTVPNAEAQMAVIQAACDQAGVFPGWLDYVEAHGTGTAIGDPIEAQALGEVLKRGRVAGSRCRIGSVKTNIGHLESASGIAGLIKTILALKHKEIPRNLHFDTPNPHIPFGHLPIEVQATHTPWPTSQSGRALAGVNSFGFGGTNAHAVLAEAPISAEADMPPITTPYGLPLSAHTPEALRAYARAVRQQLNPTSEVAAWRYSAAVCRTHYPVRLMLNGQTAAEWQEQLDHFLAGKRGCNVTCDHQRPVVRLAFIFSGQGAQWVGMGQELLQTEPEFRHTVEQCDVLVQQQLGWSLIEALQANETTSRLHQTEVTQPTLFAFQLGLAALWRSWGVEPDAVTGHSMGEVAAAYAAGLLTLKDAVQLISLRGRLMGRLAGKGGLASVPVAANIVGDQLAAYDSLLEVAAVNEPHATIVAGNTQHLGAYLAELADSGIIAQRLTIPYAFHTYQMDELLPELQVHTEQIRLHPATVPFYSTVTAQRETAKTLTADYWGKNVRQTVQFVPTIRQMLLDGYNFFLEIAPKPTLSSGIAACIHQQGADAQFAPSLRPPRPEQQTLNAALRQLYTFGYDVDWRRQYPHGGRFISLPGYPWQKQRYWLEGLDGPEPMWEDSHPLLGKSLKTATPTWQKQLQLRQLPYLGDHKLNKTAIFPGTAYMEMVLAAGHVYYQTGIHSMSDFSFDQALPLYANQTVMLQTVLIPGEDDTAQVTIYSQTSPDAGWTKHASARIQLGQNQSQLPAEPIEAVQARCTRHQNKQTVYNYLQAERGFSYGETFQGISTLWRGAGEAVAEINVPEVVMPDLNAYIFHPALLDACGQSVLMLDDDGQGIFTPVGVDSIDIWGTVSTNKLWSAARLRPRHEQLGGQILADGWLFGEDGELLMQLHGLRLQQFKDERGGMTEVESWLYALQWQAQVRTPDMAAFMGKIMVVTDDKEAGQNLVMALKAHGGLGQVVMVAEPFQQATLPLLADLQGVVYLPVQMTTETAVVSAFHLVQTIAEAKLKTSPRLWLLSIRAHSVAPNNGAGGDDEVQPAYGPLWGLGRTLAFEHPELRCVNIDLDGLEEKTLAGLAAEIGWGMAQGDNAGESQVALRRNERFVARLARYRPSAPTPIIFPSTEMYRLHSEQPGQLSRLQLTAAQRHAPAAGQVEIRVRAVGLNFRDLMKALGVYPTTTNDVQWLGDECAGEVIAVGDGVTHVAVGDEVLAIAPAAFSTFATTRAELVHRKPAAITFEQAATIPIAFCTAYYGLCELARLQPGEKVLIHAATGGVGLAAVQIARWRGAKIFATAGNPEKRAFLQSLGVEHVFDSRSLAFANQIQEMTAGHGVDVVLNSLAGMALVKSLSCLAPYGRFVEIGKRDIYADHKLGMRLFRNNLSFFAVDLAQVLADKPADGGRWLADVMHLLAEGAIELPPVQSVLLHEVREAFRKMMQARHIGKIAVTWPQHTPAQESLFAPEASYLLTGGLGALGLLVAEWMAQRGAGHIVLLGRRGVPSPAVAQRLDRIRASGTDVHVVRADLTERASLKQAIQHIDETLLPLRGVIHAAGVMDNDLLLYQTAERVRKVLQPKVRGTWNLHEATRNHALDFFVLFSSSASLLGSPHQSNYAAANAFLDSFAVYRHQLGLPTLNLNWWAWQGLGMAAQFDADGRLEEHGIGTIPVEVGLDILEQLLRQHQQNSELTAVGILPIDWQGWRDYYPPVGKFSILADLMHTDEEDELPTAQQAFLNAPPDSRLAWVEDYLLHAIAKAMQIDPNQIDPSQSLNCVGMDSLMGIELKIQVESDFGIVFPMATMVHGPSLAEAAEDLYHIIVRKVGEAN